MHRSRKF